jgi:signal peptidase I
MTRSHRTLASILVSLALLACGWWLLGPVQLGGPTGYAVVTGNSMEPRLERGDLVVVRKRDSYGVGDVVLFQDDASGVRVLHRIVSVKNGRFVTKGDHNDFLDPTKPLRADVLGELWFDVPGAGDAITWVKQPVQLAILLVLLTFFGLAGGREASKRRRRPGARPVVALPDAGGRCGAPTSAAVPTGSALAVAGGVALLLFACIGAAAWSASETVARTVPAFYTHEGTFSYAADAERDPVYPTGSVETGTPVFTRLVDDLEVAFHYRLATEAAADVQGTVALDAVVADATGWSRTFPIAPPRPFAGGDVTASGIFDVRAFEELVQRARELTAAPLNSITVELHPIVEISGGVGETPVEDSFEPPLTFSYDGTTLRPMSAPDAQPGTEPPYEPRRVESGQEIVSTPLTLGPLSLPVADARAIAVLGVLVSLVVLCIGGVLLARPGRSGAAPGIARRYGSRIVQARAIVPPERWVTEIDDMDALVRIADTYERVILHVVDGGEDVYLVDDGVAVYRHRPLKVAPTVGVPTPASG